MDNSHLWNVPFERPQETVAEYKGGTVLKFKLGSVLFCGSVIMLNFRLFRAKDLISPAIVQNGVNIPGNPYDDAFENKDVYDFHDDSERDEDCFNFTIDENPKRKKGRIKTKLPGK